jgi:signal transduction histidine kinase/CheY-like chemotaxis protein/HPt (histidine-containing phosphotransfer) domain-containing protein
MMVSGIQGKPKSSGDIGVRQIIVFNFVILIALLGLWIFYFWWTLNTLEDRTEKTFYTKTPHRIGLQQSDFLIQDLKTILTSISENLQITNLDQTIAILRLKRSELDQIPHFSIKDIAIEGAGESSYTETLHAVSVAIGQIAEEMERFAQIVKHCRQKEVQLTRLYADYLETLGAVERNVRASLHVTLAAEIAFAENKTTLQNLVDNFIEFKLGWLGTTYDLRVDANEMLDDAVKYSRLLERRNDERYIKEIRLLVNELQLYKRLPSSQWLDKLGDLTTEFESLTIGDAGLLEIIETRNRQHKQLRSSIGLAVLLTKEASDLFKKISAAVENDLIVNLISQKRAIDRAKIVLILFSVGLLAFLAIFFYSQFLSRLVDRLEYLSNAVDDAATSLTDFRAGSIADILSGFERKTATLSKGALSELRRLVDALMIFLMTIQDQYAELEAARHHAEVLNQAKSRFLANMSHEIRTPIHGVTGFIELLEQTRLTRKQLGYLDKIDLASRQLLYIVNDILDFSKMESCKLTLNLERFRLYDVIEDVLMGAFSQSTHKDIDFALEITPQVPLELTGDAVRLGQILKNLVGNAVKFTEKGRIALHVSPSGLAPADREKTSKEARIELRFTVQDTGIGIPCEQQKNIFDKFYQVDDSYSRQRQGRGLGLAICKELVELMNGTIRVDSKLGQGSTFTFTAGFESSSDRDRDHGSTAVSGWNPAERFLMVTDSSVLVTQTQQVMAHFGISGIHVDSHHSALEALLLAQTEGHPISLIVFDVVTGDEQWWRQTHEIETRLDVIPEILCLYTPYLLNHADFADHSTPPCQRLPKPLLPFTLRQTGLKMFKADQRRPAAGETNPKFTRISGLEGLRALLVEDNEINRQFALELLGDAGMHVDVAVDGKEAVERVLGDQSKPYDVVLMDIQMPIMDGYEATRIIRAKPDLQKLPIIAMTAHAFAEERHKSLAIGMDEHISKPIEAEQLLKTLARFCGRRLKIENAVDTDDPEPQVTEIAHEIDMRAVFRRLGGNVPLYRELFDQSQKSIPHQWRAFTEAIKRDDRKQAQHIIHQLKSIAGMVGLVPLEKLAQQAESALKDGLPVTPATMAQMKTLITGFTKARLEAGLSVDERATEATKIDVGNSQANVKQGVSDLHELEKALHRNAAVSVPEFDNICRRLGDVLFEPLLAELRECIFSLHYKEALSVVKRLITLAEEKIGENAN